MQHLSKLSLTVNSQKAPVTPVARKRLNLLRKLEIQIEAGEAELRDEEFLEDIRKWVRGDDGERKQITEQRAIKKWWWQHHTGAWMLTLRDGAKELPVMEDKNSIEIGEITKLVEVQQTVRSAVLAGELDDALEMMVKTKPKKPAAKGKERELAAMPETLTFFNLLKSLFYVANDEMPGDNDPVFFNHDGKRIRSFKKGLAELLIAADLRVARNGKLRDSFSFRHFYITQQIREGVGHHLLGRNVGTSSKMIEA